MQSSMVGRSSHILTHKRFSPSLVTKLDNFTYETAETVKRTFYEHVYVFVHRDVYNHATAVNTTLRKSTMSDKARLDLTIGKDKKKFLHEFAKARGITMSEVVEQMISTHLMSQGVTPHADCSQLFDMLELQNVQTKVTGAISRGMVCSFDEWKHKARELDDAALLDFEQNGIVFVPTESKDYAEIACHYVVTDDFADVISTYGNATPYSMLDTVDAYLSWYEDKDGVSHLDGLCVVAKGLDPKTTANAYRWSAPATWPKDVAEPVCE